MVQEFRCAGSVRLFHLAHRPPIQPTNPYTSTESFKYRSSSSECTVYGKVCHDPLHLYALAHLMQGSRTIYILLLAYGASTATTTLPCVMVILATPQTNPALRQIVSVTTAQRTLLLLSYIPFFVVPLVMALDMSSRVLTYVRAGVEVEDRAKLK